MSETVDQEKTEVAKTFSQEELNAVVEDRLARERKKYADYEALKDKASKFDAMEEASKSELQKATERATALEAELKQLKADADLRDLRESVAKETGVPANLLTGSDKETLEKQAQGILAFKTTGYPPIKDGGEPNTQGKPSTREAFAKAIAEAFN